MEIKSNKRNLSTSWDQFESLINNLTPRDKKNQKIVRRSTYLLSTNGMNPFSQNATMDFTVRTTSERVRMVKKKKALENSGEVPLDLLKKLYSARCQDLIRPLNLEQEAIFVKNFQQCCNSRILNLHKMNLAMASAAVISEILQTSSCLSRINLSKNQLSNEGCLEICKSIKNNPSIIEINLGNNCITAPGAGDILSNLATESLISINLSSEENLHKNTLGPCTSIERIFKSNTLSFLNLSGTGILYSGFQKLSTSLKHNRELIYLNLSNNPGIRKITNTLLETFSTTHIQELLLGSNRIKDKSCKPISVYINSTTYLKRLDLSNNLLSEIGIGEIYRALVSNSSIKSLNLSKNLYKDKNPESFVDMCSENHGLEELFLSGCGLGKYLLGFVEGLSRSLVIKKLDLSFNNITNKGAEYLAIALAKNKALQSLNLSFNRIKDKGGLALSKVLSENQSIIELNLKENDIKSKIAEVFSNICRSNMNIQNLNLDLNPINIRHTFAIKNIIERRNISLQGHCIPQIKNTVRKLKKEIEAKSDIYSKLEDKNSEYRQNKERIDKQNEKLALAKIVEEQKFAIISKERSSVRFELTTKNELYDRLCHEKIVRVM